VIEILHHFIFNQQFAHFDNADEPGSNLPHLSRYQFDFHSNNTMTLLKPECKRTSKNLITKTGGLRIGKGELVWRH